MAEAITMPVAHAAILSKFTLTSFDDDGFIFETIDDVDDGISIPIACASRRDLFLVEAARNGIGIQAFLPPAMDQQEIFILTRVGDDAALEVAKSIGRANITLPGISPCRDILRRALRAQFDSGAEQNLPDCALRFSGLLANISDRQSLAVKIDDLVRNALI